MMPDDDKFIPYDELLRRQELAKLDDKATPDGFFAEKAANEFVACYGENWRYVEAWGFWLKWSGRIWQRERTKLVTFIVRRTIARMVKRERRKVQGTLVAIVERLAQSNRETARPHDIWDTNTFVLNTKGGTLNLTSGELDVFHREDHLTKMAGATPRGDCPLWRKFLDTITAGDLKLQAYLQRVAGYCLTGSTREEVFFFAYGTGQNGKSTFIDTLTTVMGDYAGATSTETFLQGKFERHPTELAALRGLRLVKASEIGKGRRWNETRLKELTGGGTISARLMRQDFFDFEPQFKLFISGNNKPSLWSVDKAIRRRLHMLPFTVTIDDVDKDLDLKTKLLAERDGILAWAVDGCLDWQREGLKPPAVVRDATDEYLASEDSLSRWLADCCDEGPNHRAASAGLFASWKAWAEANGEFVGSQKALVQALEGKGFRRFNTGKVRVLIGLKIASTDTSDTSSI